MHQIFLLKSVHSSACKVYFNKVNKRRKEGKKNKEGRKEPSPWLHCWATELTNSLTFGLPDLHHNKQMSLLFRAFLSWVFCNLKPPEVRAQTQSGKLWASRNSWKEQETLKLCLTWRVCSLPHHPREPGMTGRSSHCPAFPTPIYLMATRAIKWPTLKLLVRNRQESS